MKVLYILSSTSTQGGASKSFMLMLEKLHAMGVEAAVIVPNTKGLYKDLQTLGIPVYAYTYRMAVYPPCHSMHDLLMWLPRLCGRIWVNFTATKKVERLCRKIQPDIIHTNVSVINIGFHAAQHLHIPHIWHIREYGALDFNYYYYYYKEQQLRKYRRPNSYTICITQDIQHYNKLNGVSSSRVIYNGILSDKPIVQNTESKKNYFLFAGHIEPCKGVYELLQAYSAYTQQVQMAFPLYIAGAATDKNYIHRLQTFINEQHLEKQVIFLDEIKDIEQWEQKAKAVVVPSLNEGFGRVMPEAMYNRTLVIAHDTAGTKEQLDNGLQLTGTEIALRYKTQKELIQHLVDVSNAPINQYQQMVEQAYFTVSKLYTTEQNAQQVYQFYQDICSNKC